MHAIKRRLKLFLISTLLICILVSVTKIYSSFKEKEFLAIGAKDSLGQILSEIIAQMIEERTDLFVKRKDTLDGTFICFNAINTKEIDMYVEYTGSAMLAILHKECTDVDQSELFSYLKNEFRTRFDLEWMDPFGFKASYVIATNSDFAKSRDLKTLSDLKRLMESENVRVAFDPEFYARPEKKLLEEKYGLHFSNLKLFDPTLLYLALLNHSVDVINGCATDGFLNDERLTILEDDENEFPPYEAAAIVRREILEKHPEIQTIFNELSGKITLEKMCSLNFRVEKKGERVYDVANSFLKSEKLNGYSSTHP